MDLNEDANNNEMDLDGDAIKAINLGFIDEIFPSDSKAKVSFLLHFFPRNTQLEISSKWLKNNSSIAGHLHIYVNLAAGHWKMTGQLQFVRVQGFIGFIR